MNPVEHIDASGMTWRIEAAYEDVVRREILPHLAELAERPGVGVVKSNRVRTVVRLTLADGPHGPEEIYLKRYHPTGARATAKSVVRVSRARQEWEMARALEAAEIPTAHPIAYAERRRGRVAEVSVGDLPAQLGVQRESGARARDDGERQRERSEGTPPASEPDE